MDKLDLATWLMVFVRASAFLAFFPLFSMQQIPVRLRIGLGALTAFLIVPALPPLSDLPATFAGVLGWMLLEAGIGLLLGFIARIFFYLLEFVGNLIASEFGMNWGSTMNLFTAGRSEAPGQVLFYLGGIIFLTLDLHHGLLLAFQRAFQLAPIGGLRLGPDLFADLLRRTSQLFYLGLLIAAPVVGVTFLINLVFSVIARAVPQMNVFVESFSFRLLAGFAVFGLTLNLMAQHAANYARRLPEDLLQVARFLGNG